MKEKINKAIEALKVMIGHAVVTDCTYDELVGNSCDIKVIIGKLENPAELESIIMSDDYRIFEFITNFHSKHVRLKFEIIKTGNEEVI